MRQNAMSRWIVIGSFVVGGSVLAFPTAAAAYDAKETEKHERQLQADATQLDADGARASTTPDGQRRVTERIAKQFKAQPAVVTDLRRRLGGYGQATIALALSQELMKRDRTLGQPAALDKIVLLRQAGKGWGVIAHEQGLKLGRVVSEVKRAEKATEKVAAKQEKVARLEKIEKPDKLDKPEKMEKPAKPEKPGR